MTPLAQTMSAQETEGGRLAAFVIRLSLYEVRYRLSAGFLQQRLEELVKDGLLFRGQETYVPFVIE